MQKGQIPECDHIWDPYTGPAATVAYYPPTYDYQCRLCKFRMWTRVKLPLISKESSCKHEMMEAVGLGPNYSARYCCNCEYQEVSTSLK